MGFIGLLLVALLLLGICLYLFFLFTKSKKLNELLRQKNTIYQNREQISASETQDIEATLQNAISNITTNLFEFFNTNYAPIERLSVSSFLKPSANKKDRIALILALYSNKPTKFKVGDELELAEFTGIELLKKGQYAIVEDFNLLKTESSLDNDLKEAGIKSSLTIPLLSNGELVGAMKVSSIVANRFQNSELIQVSTEVSGALASIIKQASEIELNSDILNKLNKKNKKAWEMSLAVHKQKEDVDEMLQLNKLELEKIEKEKEKIKLRNKKLWETSVTIHNEKQQIEKIKIEIEEKHRSITDSISYAKKIQQALLPSDELLEQNFDDYFILFEPRDIVSGDFYWALNLMSSTDTNVSDDTENTDATRNTQNTFYLCVGDCTGHGVPGAFMSLLNIAFLNENVRERNITLPHEILNNQRAQIIRALNPTGTENTKDGMDCALCAFDINKMQLYTALSNNPIWIVRGTELIEYKADKMPVGKHEHDHISFTLKTIDLEKGDIIYVLTDGYADQFGGSDPISRQSGGKKFKYKPLKELLISINTNPLSIQKEILLKTFHDWKGDEEQIDDVCLIGLKI